MVETPIDPIRMPTVTLSPKEMDEIEEQIAAGALPKDFLDRYFEAVDANVFGADAPKDKKGFRLEQGIGSPGNQTQNSIDAYRRFAKYDPDATPEKIAATLKRMEAELAASNEKRATAAPRRRQAGRR